ncbi:MAG: FAD-dependent monooxygenase [Okeania sp. SIO3H1]|nr:FAD-dependent monooxygenase [Okeania sp. SIO3H1]
MIYSDKINISQQQPTKGNHAIVIGGSIAGLLAGRILTNHFQQVTIVERDRFPEYPQFRPGVAQSHHVHVLLSKGQQILEQLFPGLVEDLETAGSLKIDWAAEFPWYNLFGWQPRFRSDIKSCLCSRHLLEWSIRRQLTADDSVQFLESTQVKNLLSNVSNSRVTGVRIKSNSHEQDLTADLVVDASGRNSSLPKWLTALGYQAPEETVINSFLGYSSRWYKCPEGFHADWKVLAVATKPPNDQRAGIIYSVENNFWVTTLYGINKDYPPTDEVGFLEFARSLRNPIVYEFIKDAQPISPVYSYRRTENRLSHYDKLSRLPDGIIAIGDAVCCFNPVYGQGMTVAALGAIALDQCLQSNPSLKGFSKYFQKQLAQVNSVPWLMATAEDLRWPGTEGAKPDWITRLIQQYLDQVLRLSVEYPEVYQKYIVVMQLTQPPKILFQPDIMAKILAQIIKNNQQFEPTDREQNIPKLLC